jgi:hypothetical protein
VNALSIEAEGGISKLFCLEKITDDKRSFRRWRRRAQMENAYLMDRCSNFFAFCFDTVAARRKWEATEEGD